MGGPEELNQDKNLLFCAGCPSLGVVEYDLGERLLVGHSAGSSPKIMNPRVPQTRKMIMHSVTFSRHAWITCSRENFLLLQQRKRLEGTQHVRIRETTTQAVNSMSRSWSFFLALASVEGRRCGGGAKDPSGSR